MRGMAVTAERARTLALALENATSYPHFHRVAFRTPRRTFATLGLDGDMNLMLDLSEQRRFCELAPQALSPVPGGWGRMGWTRCELSRIDAKTFRDLLSAAHARANAALIKKPRAQKKAPKPVSGAGARRRPARPK